MQVEDPKVKRAASKRLREAHNNQPPNRPCSSLSLLYGYAPPGRETAADSAKGTFFSPHLLAMRLNARQTPCQRLDLVSISNVASRWRAAILSRSNCLSESVRRMLSGHDAKGGPADDPHLAFLPLAFVGNEHADGHLLGMGFALPAGLSGDERREALRAIGSVRELKLGPLGVWNAEPVTTPRLPLYLRAEKWTAHPNGATHWSTVTPVVFDRHPKAKDEAQYQQETAMMVAEACTRIGLPEPREVNVTDVSAHSGVPPAFAFPRLQRKDGSQRRHTHAILVFDEPVYGPVLIGAGRFRGYGVCRPLARGNGAEG